MRTLPIVAAFFTAAALTIPVSAQSSQDAPRAGQVQHQKGQKGQKGQRHIERLRQAGVDDARIQKIVAIHDKYAQQHQKVRENAQPYREQLRKLIASNSHDEAAYQRALNGLEKTRTEMHQLKDTERREVRQILKPSEQAKLLNTRGKGGAAHPGHRAARAGDRAAGNRTARGTQHPTRG